MERQRPACQNWWCKQNIYHGVYCFHCDKRWRNMSTASTHSPEQAYAERILADIHNQSIRLEFADYIEEYQHTGGYDLGDAANEMIRIDVLREPNGSYFLAEIDQDSGRLIYRHHFCLWYTPDNQRCAIIGPVPLLPICAVCTKPISRHILTLPSDSSLCCGDSACWIKFSGNNPQDVFKRYQAGKGASIDPREIRGDLSQTK